jgi:RNA-binding protein 25
VNEYINDINRVSQEAASSGLLDKERYVIPPHLHDLQEADLPETQRGLVISEIAQFRERAAKREREKLRDVRAAVPNLSAQASPSGPKVREWGKAQGSAETREPALGQDPQQGFSKPVGFVKAGSRERDDERQLPGKTAKTDEELEHDRKEARRRDEENSFRDVCSPSISSCTRSHVSFWGAQRERRYEPRERNRIQALERAIARERATREAEDRDRTEMRSRLDIWDDDESDELFYTDRTRWRTQRARRLTAEEAADSEMRAYEAREAENLRRESEAFLARQMDELQALAEEQRKAGMLLDDGAPVRLNVSLAPTAPKADVAPAKEKTAPGVFGAEEEEEEATRKRKVPLQLLDFSAANDSEKAKERLEHIKNSVPSDRDALFKCKVRWDAVTEVRLIYLFQRCLFVWLTESLLATN